MSKTLSCIFFLQVRVNWVYPFNEKLYSMQFITEGEHFVLHHKLHIIMMGEVKVYSILYDGYGSYLTHWTYTYHTSKKEGIFRMLIM